jgi:hypothetical protein
MTPEAADHMRVPRRWQDNPSAGGLDGRSARDATAAADPIPSFVIGQPLVRRTVTAATV